MACLFFHSLNLATRSEPEKAKVAAAVAESMVAARGGGGRWVLREKAPRSGESGPCVRLLAGSSLA